MIRHCKLGILENCLLFLCKFITITLIFCKKKKKKETQIPMLLRFWRTPLPLYIGTKTPQKKNHRCPDSFNQAKKTIGLKVQSPKPFSQKRAVNIAAPHMLQRQERKQWWKDPCCLHSTETCQLSAVQWQVRLGKILWHWLHGSHDIQEEGWLRSQALKNYQARA